MTGGATDLYEVALPEILDLRGAEGIIRAPGSHVARRKRLRLG